MDWIILTVDIANCYFLIQRLASGWTPRKLHLAPRHPRTAILTQSTACDSPSVPSRLEVLDVQLKDSWIRMAADLLGRGKTEPSISSPQDLVRLHGVKLENATHGPLLGQKDQQHSWVWHLETRSHFSMEDSIKHNENLNLIMRTSHFKLRENVLACTLQKISRSRIREKTAPD